MKRLESESERIAAKRYYKTKVAERRGKDIHRIRHTDNDIMEEIWETAHHKNRREEFKDKPWPPEEKRAD